jgi:putative PIN family toxin of toxin-antitoxin system
MSGYQIVIDTNVLVSALRSQRGASHRLLLCLGDAPFDIHISVPLVLEYEQAIKNSIGALSLTEQDIDDFIDYLCAIGRHHKLYYLWRPYLRDPKDDMVLELAVTADSDVIITYNKKDFEGTEQFGIDILTPQEFLKRIGIL